MYVVQLLLPIECSSFVKFSLPNSLLLYTNERISEQLCFQKVHIQAVTDICNLIAVNSFFQPGRRPITNLEPKHFLHSSVKSVVVVVVVVVQITLVMLHVYGEPELRCVHVYIFLHCTCVSESQAKVLNNEVEFNFLLKSSHIGEQREQTLKTVAIMTDKAPPPQDLFPWCICDDVCVDYFYRVLSLSMSFI